MEKYEKELQNKVEKTKQEAEKWAKDYIQRQNEKQQQKRKANNELKEENKTQKQKLKEENKTQNQKVSNDATKLLAGNKQSDEEKMEQARKMLSFKNYHWQKAKNEILSDFTLTKDR